MKILQRIAKLTKPFFVVSGFVLIGVIGILDYVTGYEYAFSVFYVLPIYLVTWNTNRKLGFAASAASAMIWLAADISVGHPYSHPFIPVWNSLIRFCFFMIIMFLLSSLRDALNREKELSHTDYLTTVANARYFYKIAQFELDRFQRYHHPFTIAYIDIDNFKSVNDQFGHARGDLVLKTVANTVKKIVRRSDVLARLGGDEFAILFPETDQEMARSIFTKIHTALMNEMRKENLPISFSIGIVTCKAVPPSIDELIRIADELMYSVKSDGKNAVKYSIYEG